MKYDLLPLDKVLYYQIYKLALLLGRGLQKALREFGLNPERWQVLATLWNAGEELNQTKLGEITLKDKPSISRLVDAMVRDGWLVRKQDLSDSRAYLIKPSAKANAKRDAIVQALYSHFEPFQSEFGVSAQKEMMKLTMKYISIFEK